MLALLKVLLITLGIFILSALPLYFSVKVLGGKTGIFKVILVNLLVGLVAFAITLLVGRWVGLLLFILMLFIYKEFFKMGWVRALLAWLLQFAFAAIIIILLLLLGVSFSFF